MSRTHLFKIGLYSLECYNNKDSPPKWPVSALCSSLTKVYCLNIQSFFPLQQGRACNNAMIKQEILYTSTVIVVFSWEFLRTRTARVILQILDVNTRAKWLHLISLLPKIGELSCLMAFFVLQSSLYLLLFFLLTLRLESRCSVLFSNASDPPLPLVTYTLPTKMSSALQIIFGLNSIVFHLIKAACNFFDGPTKYKKSFEMPLHLAWIYLCCTFTLQMSACSFL